MVVVDSISILLLVLVISYYILYYLLFLTFLIHKVASLWPKSSLRDEGWHGYSTAAEHSTRCYHASSSSSSSSSKIVAVLLLLPVLVLVLLLVHQWN
jgi:hypothetical protein